MVESATGRALATGMSDSELSFLLLLMHGVQWIMGTKGDPYALLLRVADDDPHDLGRRMRGRGALHRSHAATWVTAHHDVASAALLDRRMGADFAPASEPDGRRAEEERILPYELPRLEQLLPLEEASLTLDRPRYERFRRLTAATRHDGALDHVHERVTALCADRIRALGPEFDLREDVAHPVAAAAVGELLGPAAPDGERFGELCPDVVGALDALVCPPTLATARRLSQAITAMGVLFDEPTGPGGDMGAACASLAVVGVEMTTNLICEAVLALLDHPDEWALVRDDPGRAALAIDETMRWSPPVRLHRLYAHQMVELGGQELLAGDELVVVAEAAGRDPAVHGDPDRFRPDRQAGPDAPALPDGPLTGLAGPVARRQAAAAVRTIAAELPRACRAGPVIRRPRSPVTRGMLRFPVAAR